MRPAHDRLCRTGHLHGVAGWSVGAGTNAIEKVGPGQFLRQASSHALPPHDRLCRDRHRRGVDPGAPLAEPHRVALRCPGSFPLFEMRNPMLVCQPLVASPDLRPPKPAEVVNPRRAIHG